MYSFIIEIKVVRNVILNNIDCDNQPSRMHRSPPKIFKIRKIQRFDISDRYFKFFIKKLYLVFIKIQVVRNDILNNLYLLGKLPILHCSPYGSFQSWPNSQIWWFLNLIDKNISDLIIECLNRNKSCQEWYFKQLIFQWKTS